MKTGEALSYGRSSLAGASDSPARDAVLLLAHVLESPPEDIYLHPDANMSVELWARYRDLIERRKAGEPVAYLRGFREFMGLTFKTDRRALIPRTETELIVEAFLETFARQPDGPAQPSCTVADLCCGSGVIGLSIAEAMPGAGVILSDVSREAVDQHAKTPCFWEWPGECDSSLAIWRNLSSLLARLWMRWSQTPLTSRAARWHRCRGKSVSSSHAWHLTEEQGASPSYPEFPVKCPAF